MTGMIQVSIDDFRSDMSHYVGKVMYGNQPVVLTKYRKPAAVVLGMDEYEKLVTKKSSKKDKDKEAREKDVEKFLKNLKPFSKDAYLFKLKGKFDLPEDMSSNKRKYL